VSLIIITMLPNQAIASTQSALRPSGAEGRGSTAPLCLQLLRTSQACTRYSAILPEITRHPPAYYPKYHQTQNATTWSKHQAMTTHCAVFQAVSLITYQDPDTISRGYLHISRAPGCAPGADFKLPLRHQACEGLEHCKGRSVTAYVNHVRVCV
jgi:hypothetical protein